MSNHSTKFKNIDIEEICGDMRSLDYEEARYLMFDKNDNYIGYISGTDNNPCGISKKVMDDMLESVLNNENCSGIIYIHNHPHEVVAIVGKTDLQGSQKLEETLKQSNRKLINSCVISELDFYSQLQANNKRKEETT